MSYVTKGQQIFWSEVGNFVLFLEPSSGTEGWNDTMAGERRKEKNGD